MVKVSIIMPIYNSEKFLRNILEKLKNQTFKNLEIICINDGSTDESLKILKELKNEDSRIIIINQENKGSGSARNKGLELASGDYIYFIDSDDMITPSTIEKLYNSAIRNNSDLVLYKIGNIKNGELIFNNILPIEKIFKYEDFNNLSFNYKSIKKHVMNYQFAPWTKFYKKAFLDSYDDFRFPENVPYEDVIFHIKCMIRASSISFVPEFLYFYNITNPNSVTFDHSTHIKIFNIIDIVKEFLKEENHYKEFEEEFEYFRLAQIHRHMILPTTSEYYNLAKEYSKDIDLSKNSLIYPSRKRKYNVLFNSDTIEEYMVNIRLHDLIEKNNTQKRINKKLKKENKKLNKQLKKEKKINEDILNSTSWKIMGLLRKLRKKLKF